MRTANKPKVDIVSDDVLAMLGEMTVEGNVLKRLQRVITRPEYLALNKVLEALGGKWHGGRVQGHVFSADPRPLIEAVLTTGEYVDPRANDVFETPDRLAQWLVTIADVRLGHRALEPSAGRGRIATKLRGAGAIVTCAELLPANAEVLRGLGFATFTGDFLTTDFGEHPFDRVVMNPPFSGQADIDHVLHAFGMLAPGGVLVAVMSGGTKFRTNRKASDFRAFVVEQGCTIEDLPDGSFKESETNVRTVVVKLRRAS